MRMLAGVLVLSGGIAFAELPSTITGDYVEIRSNHVYTCNCLSSGESVTGGREAIVAWRFQQGDFRGTSLEGTTVVAVIVGRANLGLEQASRRSVLYVGSARREAAVELLQSRYADLLGEVIGVRPAVIRFEKDPNGASIEIPGVLRVAVRPARLPEDAHLGSFLWYEPFVRTSSEVLATTMLYQYQGNDFGLNWTSVEAGISGYIGKFVLPD